MFGSFTIALILSIFPLRTYILRDGKIFHARAEAPLPGLIFMSGSTIGEGKGGGGEGDKLR